jgi:hypothetical protein
MKRARRCSGRPRWDEWYAGGRMVADGMEGSHPAPQPVCPHPRRLRFAVFCTKVHDRLLRPLMASDQPQAPPALRQALRTIDREVAVRIAATRLPAAA